MLRPTHVRFRTLASVLFTVAVLFLLAGHAAAGSSREKLAGLLRDLPSDRIETGILYDRVLPLSKINDEDGADASTPLTFNSWSQIYFEMQHAFLQDPGWPDLPALKEDAARWTAVGPTATEQVPLVLLDCAYDRIRTDALETGALIRRNDELVLGSGNPFTRHSVVAAAPLRGYTYHGERVLFRLDRRDYFTNLPILPGSFEIDLDDGQGFVAGGFDQPLIAEYRSTGEKTIRLRIGARTAAFLFEVRDIRTPSPNDTLAITATIPYLGQVGTGRAYVYLGAGHSAVTNPAVVIEGFDLDNSMGADELYELLNREQLLETLRSGGFDAVVLDFTDATDYMQRNSFVVVELLRQMQAIVGPNRSFPLAGASMGGLIGRYALSYMETHGIPHQVGTFISFDSPQTGANIPLGMQYWLAFFADDASEAAALLAALDRPAARQLLAYHHTDPPSPTGTPDPLRTQFLADLAGMGNYPTQPRLVAVANGSGDRVNQGFFPGDQIISWEYRSFLVDVTGNIWAVPNGNSQLVFHGLIDVIFLPADEQFVTVSGTRPYDNAPGGWRASMAQMDAVNAPYGDIIALHPNHCFIPSISALALQTDDPFYNIAGDPNILAHTPFDAVYFPHENQEHVAITPENVQWLLFEIRGGPAFADDQSPIAATPDLRSGIEALPNPASPAEGARIRFRLPHAGPARLLVFDAAGREVSSLADGTLGDGWHEVTWNGQSGSGKRLEPGVYFLRLVGDDFASSRKVVVR